MNLSVIIAAFNAADTIATQLEALTRQTWNGPWEVIVADNGSTDGTQSIAEQYVDRLPNLRILNASGRRGAAHARNMAVKEATGDALVFLDADDEVAPGWLSAIGTALSQHDFVASRFDDEKLNEPSVLRRRRCPQKTGLQEYEYPCYLPHAGGCGLGVKRHLFEAVAGFDESFSRLSDTDLIWRIQLAGAELHFVAHALVHVRFRDTPAATYRQARQWGEYNVKLYKKFRALGMPKLSSKEIVGRWLNLLRHVRHLRHREKRAQWLWAFHWSIGRLIGCVKYRVFAP